MEMKTPDFPFVCSMENGHELFKAQSPISLLQNEGKKTNFPVIRQDWRQTLSINLPYRPKIS
jgi:hypothetical protein